jgi:septum formation protein
MPANINEQAVPFINQYDKAEKIALAKAQKVAVTQKEAIIIAADTFCCLKNRILEKPKSLTEAKEMLRFQSGQQIEVLTGYAFLDTKLKRQQSGCEKVFIRMRQLSEQQIDDYVANQPVMTWSAAFSPAYDSGAALIQSINGNFTAFSHGLPINLLLEFLGVDNKNNCQNP